LALIESFERFNVLVLISAGASLLKLGTGKVD
jgi:hypothetical protein